MRFTFLFAIGLIVCWHGIAQQKELAGRVVDSAGQGIAYVNVILINRSDSSFVRGVVTDENGAFLVQSDRPEEQFLKFSSVGYQEIFTEVKGGEVFLPTITYNVEEVTVSGKRPVYRMKGTNFVTDVENSLLSDIGSANDVLRQLPGVTGGEGEFVVFGKGKATIYINDRLVRDASELERLNSDDIASVGLVNNPGANYDAEVRAVLKIHTKRKIEGFASRLRLRGVQNHYFSDLEQLNLSYTTDLVHWYALLYNSGPHSRVDGRNRIVANTRDTLYRLAMDMMDWKQHARYYTLESGLGVTLAQGHEVGVSYTYDYSRDIYEGQDVENLMVNDVLEEKLLNYSYSQNKYEQQKVNLYYQGKIGGKLGINWNADYIHRNARTLNNVNESALMDDRAVNAQNHSAYDLYATKLVLAYPVWKGNLEVGLDFSSMDNEETYLDKENYFPDSWFKSKEKKTAGFLNYSGSTGKLGWNVGLRYERFHAAYYENRSVEPTVERVYKELYPTVSLMYPAGPVSLSLAYSKRTSRPSFYQLRNSVDYTSRFLYSHGNPYLRSSQIHDLSLNVGFRFLQFSMGYYYTKDWIRMSDELLPGDPLSIVLFHRNEPKYQGISALLTFQHKIGFWSPTWTAGVYRDYLNLLDYNGSRIGLNDPYGQFSLNNSFSLGKGYLLNVDGFYTTAGTQGESQMRPEGSVDIGVRKSFFKGALDVSLQCWDVFRSSKNRMTIYSEHVEYYRWGYKDNRSVRLTLTYHFNKYRNRYKGVNSAESEMRRM